MLSNMGISRTGGDASEEVRQNVDAFLRQFESEVLRIGANLAPRKVRLLQDTHVFCGLTPEFVFVAYQAAPGAVPSYIVSNLLVRGTATVETFKQFCFDYLMFDDPAILTFSREVLRYPADAKEQYAKALAQQYVSHERQRVSRPMQSHVSPPVFGLNVFPIQPKLVFVLMPFEPKLDAIYKTVVKPVLENDCQLISRRADEITDNKAVMQDIWKSICEAEIVLADLSGFNPNVMYELGIAHTLGKETVLLFQRNSSDRSFPFDLAHIRRIEYDDSAAGGELLKQRVRETLLSIKGRLSANARLN